MKNQETVEYAEGVEAARRGEPFSCNPYGTGWVISDREHPNKVKSILWDHGWSDASRGLERRQESA